MDGGDIAELTFTDIEKCNQFNFEYVLPDNLQDIDTTSIQDDVSDNDSDSKEYYIGIAGITDYKTSVFMNTLFRNIKENSNLDLLEESDDEEEFQNVAIDKFVNLDKQLKMRCVYIDKFQAWKPVEVMSDNAILSSKRDIRCKY
mgnify:CR=1 FL=1